MKHILTADQFSREELLDLFQAAKKLQTSKRFTQTMKGKILATAFFEPSTRTRLSFETAMLRLGGQVISIPNEESSSVNKGESMEDTGRMISTFADIIAVRSKEKGQVRKFATHSTVPVINCGDGMGEHPTQHLLDLYTIWKERGSIDGVALGLMGDGKHSRVLRGMAKMAAVFDVKIIFIAPQELQVEDDVISFLQEKKRPFAQVESLSEVIGELDVLETNRLRVEYIIDKSRAALLSQQFILNRSMVEKGKKDLIVLDPLPRVNTIQEDVDVLPQAKYFEAVKNGLFIRMALINHLLG